ncbi:MAG TPA: putative porin [Terriglobales bacterium]|nr:putative porin [Terriglobales bacterium]
MTHTRVKVAALILSFLSLAAGASAANPVSPGAASASPPADSDSGDLRSEVEQLKQIVQQQQKRIDALEAERSGTQSTPATQQFQPGNSSAQTSPGSSPQAPSSTANLNYQNAGSSDERIRNLEREIKGLGPISFSGDIRLREEPIFGGPSDQSLDRTRARVRARFNVLADLGEQFRAGFSLASGDINDPTTTNQTLTSFYSRKTFALDQAFVEFRPRELKELTLIGGKFRYPWYNTELTWDKDLNPEGAAETFAYTTHNSVFKRFALVAFQLPFAEVAATSVDNKRINQQITYGGQLQTTWQVLPRLQLSAYSGFYWYQNANSIALALARASTKNPQTPLTGLLPLGTGNTVQNSIYTTTATNVVTIAGKTYPTGVTSIYNAQYASAFALFDNIARFDIDTGHPKYPIAVIGDYVQNTEACANAFEIAAPPPNTASVTYSQTHNFPCVSNQRRGYWAEARVGRLQKKGDFQAGYTRIYIEREAVVSNFNYSDILQGSNVTEHRFDSFYQFAPSVQLGFTALVGRPLASTQPWLTRLQLDTIYIF